MVTKDSGVSYLDWWDFYFRINTLAQTYLPGGADAVCYITSGGMSVAHRLIHALNLTIDKRAIVALPIERHRSHEIQARPHDVHAEPGGADLGVFEGKRVLLVDDALGSGQTLVAAHALVSAAQPSRIDTVILGVDHRDRNERRFPAAQHLIENAIVGFDYWGWLIFPWEAQAADGFGQTGAAPPYQRLSVPQRREALVRSQPLDGVLGVERCRSFVHVNGLGPVAIVAPPATPGANFGAERLFEAAPTHARFGALCLPHALPSQIGCAHWLDVLRAAAGWLVPGGMICFDYADRMSVCSPDALTGAGAPAERYTDALMTRLLNLAGYDVIKRAQPDALGHALICGRRRAGD